jgi:hypothetical protein
MQQTCNPRLPLLDRRAKSVVARVKRKASPIDNRLDPGACPCARTCQRSAFWRSRPAQALASERPGACLCPCQRSMPLVERALPHGSERMSSEAALVAVQLPPAQLGRAASNRPSCGAAHSRPSCGAQAGRSGGGLLSLFFCFSFLLLSSLSIWTTKLAQ